MLMMDPNSVLVALVQFEQDLDCHGLIEAMEAIVTLKADAKRCISAPDRPPLSPANQDVNNEAHRILGEDVEKRVERQSEEQDLIRARLHEMEKWQGSMVGTVEKLAKANNDATEVLHGRIARLENYAADARPDLSAKWKIYPEIPF